METFKKTLLTDWHLMRLVRLVVGVGIAVQAFQMQSALIAFFSAFFLFQAITNTGCCGASGCPVKPDNKDDQHPDDLVFEEVRSNKG
jgi:hypothetical protein